MREGFLMLNTTGWCTTSDEWKCSARSSCSLTSNYSYVLCVLIIVYFICSARKFTATDVFVTQKTFF